MTSDHGRRRSTMTGRSFSMCLNPGVWAGSIALALLIASAIAIPANAQPGSPETDRAALVALYEANGGPNWTNSTNWLSDAPLDTWYGVTTDDSGRVTTLDLSVIGLGGAIPHNLGTPDNLIDRNPDTNEPRRQIPPQLGSLTNLTSLSLKNNRLQGQIPPELGSLGNIQRLDLSFNHLTGQIPSQLGSLPNLEYLSLFKNQLNGQIPPELGSLANLSELYLGKNQLSGQIPSEIGNLDNMSELNLSKNQLSGQIPRSLAALPNRRLGAFLFGYNAGLCASADDAFQRWPKRIRWSGDVCPSASGVDGSPTPTRTPTDGPMPTSHAGLVTTPTNAPAMAFTPAAQAPDSGRSASPVPTNAPAAESTPTPAAAESGGGCIAGTGVAGVGDVALMILPLLGVLGLAGRRRRIPGRPQ